MRLLFKARGNASIAPLLIRLVLGTLFLTAGASKLIDIQGYIFSLQALKIMPDNLAFIIGFILPFAQVILGGLYIIGFFTPVVSLLLSMMLIGILFAMGAGDPELPFSYNFIFLACTLSTIFSGAGVVSFDVFFDKKRKSTQSSHVTGSEKTDRLNISEAQVTTEENQIELLPSNGETKISGLKDSQ